MNLEVRKVNNMPFVKYPLKNNVSLPHCNCKLIRGKFGPSLAIFLDSSHPSVREKMEDVESKLQKLVRKIKPRIEAMLRVEYDEEDLKVKLIKNGVVWAKCPRNCEVKYVSLWFSHIFFSECRISISVEAV